MSMMKLPRSCFDWVRSVAGRVRPEPKPEVNDGVLARLGEHDGVYRALMDHAHGRFEAAVSEALKPELTPDERAFWCGAAREAGGYILQVESTRANAREMVKDQSKK